MIDVTNSIDSLYGFKKASAEYIYKMFSDSLIKIHTSDNIFSDSIQFILNNNKHTTDTKYLISVRNKKYKYTFTCDKFKYSTISKSDSEDYCFVRNGLLWCCERARTFGLLTKDEQDNRDIL